MHILTIGTDEKLFDPDSAVARRVIEYAALAGSMDIIVLTTKQFEPLDLSPRVRVYATGSLSRFTAPWSAAKIARRLPHHFDLVSVQDPFDSGIAGALVSREFKLPLHVQVHTDVFTPEYQKLSVMNRVRVMVARHIFRRADCVRVVSSRVKRNIEKAGVLRLDTPISILPIWVDVQKIVRTPMALDLHKKYLQFDTIFLMASRLTSEKNIPLALSAFATLLRDNPKVGLIIVGDGPILPKLREIVAKRFLGEHVIFEPWNSDLTSYYKSADGFILSSNFEGYGLTLIEAAAAGCPIITTDVGCVGDVLSSERVLVSPPGDERGLLRSMQVLAKDPARAKALARMTQSHLARAISHDEYLRLYKESWLTCLAR